jgi:hypothetical protein
LDKILVLLLVALVFTVSIFGLILNYASNLEIDESQSESWTGPERSPEPEPYNITLSSRNLEVVQGKSAILTLYVTSVVHETDATMIFSWYLGTYQNQSWSSTESSPFEVTFNPNQLILEYMEPRTTVMTISVVDDASLGVYRINLEPSASTGTSSFSANLPIWVTVIP